MRSCNATIPCLPGEAHSTDRAGSTPAMHWRYRGWCLLDPRGRERRKRRWWSHGRDDVSQPCTGRVGKISITGVVVVPSQVNTLAIEIKYTGDQQLSG